MLTSIDIDEIAKSGIDDLVEILKTTDKIYIGYDNKQNMAIANICTAMNQIGYKKGYKRGKSVGSHSAYGCFVKNNEKIKKALEWDKLGYDEEVLDVGDVKYAQGFNAGIDRALYYLGCKHEKA